MKELEGKDLFEDQEPANGLLEAADALVSETEEIMRTARTEEDLRIGFEKILDPILKRIGVARQGKYEKSVYKGGRSDALHGQVIIEYESPGSFKSKKSVHHAYEQLVGYIQGEAKQHKEALFILDPKLVGVGFDGKQIFFVLYQGDRSELKLSLNKKDFIRVGPYPLGRQSSRTFLTYMRELSRKLLTAKNLADDFGPNKKIARLAVSALVDAFKNWTESPRVRTYYAEWQRLFGIVYGEHFTKQQQLEVEHLVNLYGVKKDTGFQELLFCVHTYFVFLMKLIVAELLSVARTSPGYSFCDDLAHCPAKSLRSRLREVEEGGIYAKQGITNFLEGDFFRWYLDAFSPPVQDAVREIARGLAGFDPATTTLHPESHRDLLKKLYQYLVPKEVRHKLGEYYTPDWLAELVLKEVGYTGDATKRLLDPACGSGTFLVLAIHKAKQFSLKKKISPKETAKRVVANIWGFDLNPLAVIAARTNYLFALGELVHELSDFEIPIYLADSVLWPRQTGQQMDINFEGGDYIPIATSLDEPKKFFVPLCWINDRGFLMKKAAPLIEEMAKNDYSEAEALKRLKKKGLVFPPNENVIKNFYGQILKLEREGKNGIWARFLKNAFAPVVAGEFDFVVGNPPWIRWGYLSQDYREATLSLWQRYGLFSLKGHAARLGGGEKDFSMLFTYASIDYYVKNKGKLGFLITQEVFKSKGAGEGFRRFRFGDEGRFKVLKAHDLVSIKPFEDAANKTAMIIIRKGPSTTYPVPYTVWTKKKRVGRIPTDALLEEAMPVLKKTRKTARPIRNATGAWQTLEKGQEVLNKIGGSNAYSARLGARVEPYGVFLLGINQVMSDGNLLIHNMAGIMRTKRDVPEIRNVLLESDLVFPAVAGRDIERWKATPNTYMLMTQDPKTREPYPEKIMKTEWPRTYAYLTKFKDILLSRGSNTVRELAERTAFYAMFAIGSYTVARYKVVWKRMANDLVAAVISQHKTPFGYKMIIPTDTTSIIAVSNKKEAHFICAVLNSTLVRDFIKSFSSGGRGFGAPSVMKHVGLPEFDKECKLHKELADLSETLHELKKRESSLEIPRFESEVDKVACRLFGINGGGR